MNNKYFKMLIVLGLVVVIGVWGGVGVFAQSPSPSTNGGDAFKSTNAGDSLKSTNGGGTTKSTTGGGVPQTSDEVFTITNPLKVDSIGGLVQTLVEIFSYIAILFAVVVFIYIGFQYVVKAAQGNTSEITKLHGMLFYLIVGVAVVISARVIVQLVINTLSAIGTIDKGVIESANNALKANGTK